MYTAGRPGNDGLVHKYHGRKKHGNRCSMGNTSKFAIVITQFRNRKVEAFFGVSFEKPKMNVIINHIMQLKQKHHITKIYVDGANPEVIRELKSRIGEYHNYYGRLTEEQIWGLRTSNSWQIIPVNFRRDTDRCFSGHIRYYLRGSSRYTHHCRI